MVDGSTEAGQTVLDTIEGGDQIELVGCAHEPNVCPTAEQLIGIEGWSASSAPSMMRVPTPWQPQECALSRACPSA